MISINLIVAIILAYLIGSIPTSVWIGRVFYDIDVRTKGSGNAGATNTIRVLGPRAGVPVLIFDIFKGWFAVFISRFFYDPSLSFPPDLATFDFMLAVAAVVGHVFPIYVGFKGGKGIATILGVGIALYPMGALIAIIVFLIMAFSFHYISLASITAAITFPFVEIFILGYQDSIMLMILAIAIGVFVPVTHRKNISRLLKGEESKFSLRKKS